MAYDLVVDCGDSLQRVQVKTAHSMHGDRYRVRLTKRRVGKPDTFVRLASLDYLCVVCNPNYIYVIPAITLQSPTDPTWLCATLEFTLGGTRFAPYLNAFAIGTGFGTGDETDTIMPTELKTPWYPTEAVATRHRKRHTRLTVNEINQLRMQAGENPTPARKVELAEQFHITRATLRNYLNGARKDLQPSAGD